MLSGAQTLHRIKKPWLGCWGDETRFVDVLCLKFEAGSKSNIDRSPKGVGTKGVTMIFKLNKRSVIHQGYGVTTGTDMGSLLIRNTGPHLGPRWPATRAQTNTTCQVHMCERMPNNFNTPKSLTCGNNRHNYVDFQN